MAENFIGLTNTGRVRTNNEDTFIAEQLPNGWLLACVIDGVGGYEGGEVAAEIAKDTLWASMQKAIENPEHTLSAAILRANQNIYNEKLQAEGKSQMACVMTAALIDTSANQFYYAHVGDTRLYLLRDQSLVKLTKDHSFVGFLEDSGRISEKEAMEHPKRNEINKALGFDPQIDRQSDYIETGSSPFLSNDLLLLCSDGLTDLVDRAGMTNILVLQRSLQEKAEALIDAANFAGGKDNITVVLASNNKKPLKAKATKPVLKKRATVMKEEPVPVSKPAPQPVKQQAVAPRIATKKKTSGALVALSVLCALLLIACIYFWWSGRKQEQPLAEQPVHLINETERKFRDSLSLKEGLFTVAGNERLISLSDTVFIRQDTLHINGNGLVLTPDSSFAGPAFFSTINSKSLVLENMIFKNFTTAILLQGKGLQLRNVQFVNCNVPVLKQFQLPADSSLTGTIKDSFLVSRNALNK